MIRDAMTNGEIGNRNFEGLLAILVGAYVGNLEYVKNNMHKSSETKEVDTKEELKLTLINDFDKATEYTKEAARLQQEASYCTQKALALQKEALLKNLEYG